MKPTAEQIAEQITALRELRGRLQSHTLFGDDNHAAIDAAVLVLEQRLTEDDCDCLGLDVYESICAVQAAQWVAGVTDETPAGGWM